MSAVVTQAVEPTMSSKDMSELAEKRHDSVKRTIDILAERGVIQLPHRVEVTNHLGQTVIEYRVGKRDSYVVMAQISPEFTARLVDRWQELEEKKLKPAELSTMDILKIAMESEKGRLLAIEQRDHAIATKAQIGSKREASAMATASAAVREVAKLKSLIGEAPASASILAVQNKTGVTSFQWQKLKNYCATKGLVMKKAFNPGLQLDVNTYPAEAWHEVYGIDIQELFGTRWAA